MAQNNQKRCDLRELQAVYMGSDEFEEDKRESGCLVFNCFYDGDGVLQLTLDKVPEDREKCRRFGDEYMMFKSDIERIRKDFPGKEVVTLPHILECGPYNTLWIDKEIPVESLIQKGYLKPLDIGCLEYG